MPPEEQVSSSQPPIGQGGQFDADSAFLAHLEGGQPPEEPEQEEQEEELEDEQPDSSETDLDEETEDLEDEELSEDETELEEDEIEPEDPVYKLKVQGEEVEVPLSELQSSYMRQSDYTKKTQALSEQRKQIEQERVLIQQIQENLNSWSETQQAVVSSEIQDPGIEYWNELQQADPMKYLVERDKFREAQVQQQDALRKSQELQRQMQERQQLEQSQYLQVQQERLLEVLPEWKDEKTASADKMRLRDYGLSVGISEEELSAMADHRAVLMMYKAQKYDELQARRKTIKPKNQKIAPSHNKPQGRRKQTKLKKAKQQLAKTGSIADADNAFLELLTSKR